MGKIKKKFGVNAMSKSNNLLKLIKKGGVGGGG